MGRVKWDREEGMKQTGEAESSLMFKFEPRTLSCIHITVEPLKMDTLTR